MSVHRAVFRILCAVGVAVSMHALSAFAATPPWWGDATTRDDPSQPSSTNSATGDARRSTYPDSGPVLEDYPVVPKRADARALSSPRVSTEVERTSEPLAADDRYGIQPGDLLVISVWREPDLTREVRVSPDGRIAFPLIGDLAVEGETVEALRADLEARLGKLITQAVVDVSIKEVAGNRVYVLGKVNRPGMYPFTKSLDVVQALSLAGGTAKFAAIDQIKILRRTEGQQQTFAFRYSDVERGRDLEQNIVLKSGDVVVVP